ncbi:TPA_asm: hypothetical protein G1X41_11525 [Salmonella enterica subsp. enterica serovar Typhimurium str. SL1344]|uniref:Uncharacterized protein n=1 Tax=Salmonella typhimurium (strain SL1344) TaxID=216597 RepID=A0A718Y0L2_SALTS|nr:hypothetical protein [Salmonella enterica subsp. enterica serovar Typhimurium str. SL1344]
MIIIAQTETTIHIVAIYETITHDDRVLPTDFNHLKNKARNTSVCGLFTGTKKPGKIPASVTDCNFSSTS